jgi:hypothetical protein
MERLAEELAVTPETIDDWEANRIPIPRVDQSDLRWVLQVAAQERLLEAAGLPECSWFKTQVKASDSSSRSGLRELHATIEAHTRTCPVCRARADYLRHHGDLGPLPKPTLWGHQRASLLDAVGSIPSWLKRNIPVVVVTFLLLLVYLRACTER